MGTQTTLFDFPPRKRKPRRQIMHVIDADTDCACCDADHSHNVRFACKSCGHETGWIRVANVTEGKRGKPCPKCNMKGSE